jgi:hypothetical protein
VVFITGAAGYLGWVPLPAGLQVLQNPLVLGASGLMVVVEFFADKIPALDSLWDLLHTFIRIPAGAALAAGVFGGDRPPGPPWPVCWAARWRPPRTPPRPPRARRSTPRPSRSPTSACRCWVTPRCRRCCGWPGSTRCVLCRAGGGGAGGAGDHRAVGRFLRLLWRRLTGRGDGLFKDPAPGDGVARLRPGKLDAVDDDGCG